MFSQTVEDLFVLDICRRSRPQAILERHASQDEFYSGASSCRYTWHAGGWHGFVASSAAWMSLSMPRDHVRFITRQALDVLLLHREGCLANQTSKAFVSRRWQQWLRKSYAQIERDENASPSCRNSLRGCTESSAVYCAAKH
eukprot:1516631-Rhodomonas_salina.1